MNFFKIKTTWSNSEFIVFKLCVASAYILIGAYFNRFVCQNYRPILILFGISVVWVVSLWLKKMRESQ
ncbi:MAG: hypothetical protein NTV75_11355 [Bacteroidia bacterium]|nr:hypothetical protein [Bacteroidia bacterium]